MTDEPKLPFRVLDGALTRMKRAVNAGTDVARSALGRERAEGEARQERDEPAAPDPSPQAKTSDAASAGPSASADADAREPACVPDGPAPDETATAAPALATALDEEARAALAKHAGGAEGTDPERIVGDLAVKPAKAGQPAPEEELGPEPFTPQVGP